MKSIFILASTFLCITNIYAQKDCNEAFSAANYSVAHSNNAYDANNIFHVQEWAFKAMETFSEVESITNDCGCEEASELAYEGYEAASKAQEQNTWERSRFYAKRASEKARLMIEALAEFTNNDVTTIQDAGLGDSTNESSKAARELEVQSQLAVKANAEAAFAKISDGYQSLADALGCKYAYKVAKSSYEVTKEEISRSNLTDTKMHYTLQLNDIAEKAMLNFSNCADSL